MDRKLNTIEEAIEDIKAGKLVIVVDDEDRENEGDFITAAQNVTPEIVNFMAREGRGLICTPLIEDRCDELGLDLMVGKNTVLHHTQFTVSVDLIGHGCTTGISVHDRAATIQALVNPDTKPEDLGKPGHIFPLKAREGGVLRRAGHTEAAIDLARLAGFEPAGVLIEILNEDGSMARLPDLFKVADKHDLKVVSIEDLIKYRLKHESLIEKEVKINMPTKHGNFELTAYTQTNTGETHFALTKGEWNEGDTILTRVHSSCVTGDLLDSLRCDCGDQLAAALQMIEKEGKGALIYMQQEGRGIGLLSKLKAYKLQEEGMNTYEANEKLGFDMDQRDYGVGAQILRDLKISKMKLMSNNPKKRVGLIGHGLEVVENIAIEIDANPHNHEYLKTKKEIGGHEIMK
ncbi:MAG: bifunctional 3,4-dihydroxy-2-butanone-4-phosphate synthase/GTP cyclohydrolase II [Chitinophagales bacterium]